MNSIEWLIEQYEQLIGKSFTIVLFDEIEQAKEMHKQEMADAFIEGKSNGMDISHPLSNAKEISFEDYYQETFVSKGSGEVELLFKCKCGYETSDSVSWCVHADCCNGNDR